MSITTVLAALTAELTNTDSAGDTVAGCALAGVTGDARVERRFKDGAWAAGRDSAEGHVEIQAREGGHEIWAYFAEKPAAAALVKTLRATWKKRTGPARKDGSAQVFT